MKDDVLGRTFTVFRDLPERNRLTRSRGITATAEEAADGSAELRFVASEAPRDRWPYQSMTIRMVLGGIVWADGGVIGHATEASTGDGGAPIYSIAALAGGSADVFDTGATAKATRDPRYLIRLGEREIARVESFAQAKAIACGLANARTDREADEFAPGVMPRGWTLEAPQP